MKPEEKSFFVLLVYFISMTLLAMAVTAVWYPDVGLEVRSPFFFLFGVGCAIALPITLCFLPFSRHASLAYVARYCRAIGDEDVPDPPPNYKNKKYDNPYNYNTPHYSDYYNTSNKVVDDNDVPYDAPDRIPINTLDNIVNNAPSRGRNRNTATPTAVPYLIVIFSYVIFFCLNVLLLDAYLYSQHCNTIKVSVSVFVERMKALLTEHLVTVAFLLCYLGLGFYATGEISSYAFNWMCHHFRLDHVPGGLVICAVCTWFVCGFAVILCYWLLPDEKGWKWKDVGLFVFSLTVCVIYLIIHTCRGRLVVFPLPRYPRRLLHLMNVVLVITAVATILTALPQQVTRN